MNIDTVRAYVSVQERLKTTQEEVDKLKEEAHKLEQVLLQEFEQDGLHSINADGVTVFLHRQLWARPINHDRLAEALTAAGYGHYVEKKINTHRISALVRESETEGYLLPETVRSALDVTETFSIRVRKA